MLATRAWRCSLQVDRKPDRGFFAAALVYAARNSKKVAAPQEAALSPRGLQAPPSKSGLVPPQCAARFLSTSTAGSRRSVVDLSRSKCAAGLTQSPLLHCVNTDHDVGCSRSTVEVGLMPIVRTLTTGSGSGILGSCSAANATAGRGRRGVEVGVRRCMSAMSEKDFHVVADEVLEDIHDAVEEALEEGFEEDFDCNMAQGVLNIVVSDRGTWVLNKQSPNRQIWWSSPISGPMRFEYDGDGERWVNTRDGKTDLLSILADEMREKCNVSMERLLPP